MGCPHALVIPMKKKETAIEKTHSVAATIAFFSELIRFVIIPLILIDVIMSYYPLLSQATATWLASHLLVIGAFVALFVAMETYFPRGSWLKLMFGVFAVVTLCVWFWFLLETGSIEFPYGPLSISLNIIGLAIVILIAVALKGLLPVGQFIVARKEIKRKKMASASAAGESPSRLAPAPVPVLSTPPSASATEEEPPPPEDFLIRCPACRSKISASKDVCPNCGTWIRQKKKM
jgi:hypothetical protein